MNGIESLSVAWGGLFGWFNVKLLSCGKSELGDAVIRWMLELLMNAVGAVVDFVDHFASALILKQIPPYFKVFKTFSKS